MALKVYTYHIMSSKAFTIFGCAALAVSAIVPSYAQEAEAAGEAGEAKPDNALKAEMAYVEALIDCGFPDFAAPVIEETKKKWPEADALFFAIEIRGMLSLGKFDEAEAKIAALPDRNGSKYWAARLEVANNFFARGKKSECSKIYSEFFAKFATPPKELREFYLQASYSWGQILVGDKKFDEATKVYEGLLAQLKPKTSEEDANIWCNVACETAEMYLHLAKEKKALSYLDSAKKLVDKLLWMQDKPVYFGRAIAMKAHIELMKGNVDRAQRTIDDYMDQLAQLHEQIVEYDPDGRGGLLRQSPMPMCRYMLADMLWGEAQAEFKKPKHDDERIKSLLFGEKGKSGKRNGAGAFNHALNVFIKFPESTWAAQAGEMSEAIREFAEKNYGAKVKTNIKPEDLARVRQMQFRAANDKFAENDYEGAIKDYLDVLSRFPEMKESISAIENLVTCYVNLMARSDDEAKKADWRLDADAVEGYIAERFGGNKNREIMTLAGESVLRIAAKEKQFGELARADRLYKAFLLNYRRHVTAAATAAALAGEAQTAEHYTDAIALYEIIDKYYTNSIYHATALAQLSVCHEKLGDRNEAIAAMKRYCEVEKTQLRRLGAQMSLAVMYKNDGFDILTNAETNETPEAVDAQLKLGTAQIVRGIKQFRDFAAAADKALADPSVPAGEKKQYQKLKEGAIFLIGDSWGRMQKPPEKIEGFRKNAIASLEDYVKQFPKGQYARMAYVRLATMYTALNDVEKSKEALDSLQREFPDSDEAKNAKPRLAKALIEMGMVKEGTAIYAEMLRLDGAYTAGQFVNAGEALINARDWSLANQAFDKAIAKAGTNQMTTVARARIGLAKALYKQKNYVEAMESLDLFMKDDKMSRLSIAADANLLLVDVASEVGRVEKDDKLRKKYYGTAYGAIKKLKVYWKSKPQHEQDAIDLMTGDVILSRIRAEEAMGLKEQAEKSCESAAALYQGFIQSHGVSEDHPADKMSPGELANLERCYSAMVPVYAKLGPDRADFVLKYGQQYLDLFPNGRARTEIQNCMNTARTNGATVEEEKPAEASEDAAAEDAPAEADGESAEEPAAESEEAPAEEAAPAEAAPAAEAEAEKPVEEESAEKPAENNESEGDNANE